MNYKEDRIKTKIILLSIVMLDEGVHFAVKPNIFSFIVILFLNNVINYNIIALSKAKFHIAKYMVLYCFQGFTIRFITADGCKQPC